MGEARQKGAIMDDEEAVDLATRVEGRVMSAITLPPILHSHVHWGRVTEIHDRVGAFLDTSYEAAWWEMKVREAMLLSSFATESTSLRHYCLCTQADTLARQELLVRREFHRLIAAGSGRAGLTRDKLDLTIRACAHLVKPFSFPPRFVSEVGHAMARDDRGWRHFDQAWEDAELKRLKDRFVRQGLTSPVWVDMPDRLAEEVQQIAEGLMARESLPVAVSVHMPRLMLARRGEHCGAWWLWILRGVRALMREPDLTPEAADRLQDAEGRIAQGFAEAGHAATAAEDDGGVVIIPRYPR